MFDLVVTEGLLEEPAARRVFDALGIDHKETRFVPKGGKEAFWRDVRKYNQAARHTGPILGVADLEAEPCPSGLIARHLPYGKQPGFVLRIAERMLESWLLADREAISRFLRVPIAQVPVTPDGLPHPKQALVNLARRSVRREIVEDMVPPRGGGGLVGRGYTSRMTQFVRSVWRPEVARANSESLRRAMSAIAALRSKVPEGLPPL